MLATIFLPQFNQSPWQQYFCHSLTRYLGNNIFVQNETGTQTAQGKFAKISNIKIEYGCIID